MSEKYEIKLDGVEWRKSSFSSDDHADCVEVAPLPNGHVGVRDSKDPDAKPQVYTPSEWAAFTQGLLNGEFDDLGLTGE